MPRYGPERGKEGANVPMVLSERGVSRGHVDGWFRQRDINPRNYAQVAGNEAIGRMVSLGFGIGVVPKIVLDNSPLRERVQVLDVKPELAPYDIGLFALNKSLKNPMVEAFWSLIEESV